VAITLYKRSEQKSAGVVLFHILVRLDLSSWFMYCAFINYVLILYDLDWNLVC